MEAAANDLAPAAGLTSFELATGYAGGVSAGGPVVLPAAPADLTPLDALVRAVLPALERGGCYVSFSGGRDSSAVLAVAALAARRHGLPLPIPVTLRFPDAPGSEESEWQERVVSHLDLEHWERVEVGDELDYVGPVAGVLLRRHGVLFPFNTHYYVPLLERVDGGTLLTGGGGDALFQTWRWLREALVVSGRRLPRPRDLPRLAYYAAPLSIRRRAAAARTPHRPWLTPHGHDLLRQAIARDADEPRRYDARLAWLLRRRYMELSRRSADIVGADYGVRIEHPLVAPQVVAIVAREGGRLGPGDRTAAMRRFFGSVLPDDVLSRRRKAHFGEVFFRSGSRKFLASWDGPSPFPDLVDPEGLRQAWATEAGDRQTTPRILLQATWLASARVSAHGRSDLSAT